MGVKKAARSYHAHFVQIYPESRCVDEGSGQFCGQTTKRPHTFPGSVVNGRHQMEANGEMITCIGLVKVRQVKLERPHLTPSCRAHPS